MKAMDKKELMHLFQRATRWKIIPGEYVAVDNLYRIFMGKAGKMKQMEVLRFITTIDAFPEDDARITLKNGHRLNVPWGPSSQDFKPKFDNENLTVRDATDADLVASLGIPDIAPKPKN
jgi:hypothetical protein